MIALLSMGVATYRLMPNDQHFATFFPLHLNVAMDLSPLGIESVCIPAARPNDFGLYCLRPWYALITNVFKWERS